MTHRVIVGLGFGDEGKGSITDYLCATEDIKAVIRYNGGPQAAHNVVLPDGRHHTFSQFGSGTFQGIPTHLSQFMLVNPLNMVPEAEHLIQLGIDDPFEHTTIAAGALLVTPYHREANRIREDLRGFGRHGSTGQGVGETREYALDNPKDAPIMADLGWPAQLGGKLEKLIAYYVGQFGKEFIERVPSPQDVVQWYFDLMPRLNIVSDAYVTQLLDSGDCVFEGAQGVLLDELVGFNPHTTWTKTTQENARTLLDGRQAEVYGLTRSYHTRHGAGPFPSEAKVVCGDVYFPEPHNGTGQYQGAWRVGELDLGLLEYAIRVNRGIDKLVVSHVDYIGNTLVEANHGWSHPEVPGVVTYLDEPRDLTESENLTKFLQHATAVGYDLVETEDDLVRIIEDLIGVRPYLLSYGPTFMEKRLADVPAPA